MDIPINAEVRCADGPCGRSTCIVIGPKAQRVTHLVVRRGLLDVDERLVPIDQVLETTPKSIQLRCTLAELDGMDRFIEREYVMVSPNYFIWLPEIETVPVVHRRVPQGGLTIERGSRVEATDGRVGQVDELLVDPLGERITHLVLREGHLWGQKDVTIPISEVDHIEANTVYLKLDKHSIEALPTVPVWR
jgi:sporulation protein YlmC with PRC-barrel domain